MEKLVKQIIGRHPQRSRWSWPKNWILKLLSLFFAIFLWYFVVGEDKVDMTVYIPVEIVNLPRDLIIANQSKKQLEVTVSGPRGLIRSIANQHISRPVDLAKASPGTILVRNNEESIPFPRGIRVLRVQPPYITLLLDRLIQKELPVKAVTSGEPAPDYQIASLTLEPSVMTITGPQEVLGEVTELVTTPIDLTGLKSSITRQVPLDLQPAIAEMIGETAVNAKVTVVENTVTKTVAHVPVLIVHDSVPTAASVAPNAVTVKAEIPVSLTRSKGDLRSLFKASISSAGLPPGQHAVQIRVETTRPIKLLDVSPDTVQLTIGSRKRKR
ncbi:MAG: CdaR family protein [Desulfobulbaceae bacterium]|nr:CdaR family protein [Desulfobulbaceae bacterium]